MSSHFSFAQICRICKKSWKTFRVDLSSYDENGFFCGNKEEMYFSCCGTKNFIKFDEICNPFTAKYLKTLNQIEQINYDLLMIRIGKLEITK